MCDKKGRLALLSNPVISEYTKHAAVRFFFAREANALGHVVPCFVASEDKLADIFPNPSRRYFLVTVTML